MKKYIELAETLFTLELESISNDTEAHFGYLGNNWLEKFGERSLEFESKLTTKNEDVKELAKMLQKDFKNGECEVDGDGIYHYMMPNAYGGFICNCLEKQLADLTGIGTQSELVF